MNRFWYKGASITGRNAIEIRFSKWAVQWFNKYRIKDNLSGIRIVR